MSDGTGADFDLYDGDVYSPMGGHARHRSAVRASDADREAAADELRRHHASGRLDTDELSERLSAAYAARTHGGLDKLFVDLPPAGPPARSVPMAPVRSQGSCRCRSFLWPVIVPLFIVGGLLSDHHSSLHDLGAAFLAFAIICCCLGWAATRALRSGSRFFYHAGRHWARHRSRW